VDFVSFYFISHFYFILDLFFTFSIFRTLGLGLKVISHAVTLVTSDGMIPILITELKRKKSKVLEQSDVIQHRHHMLTSCFTHGHLG